MKERITFIDYWRGIAVYGMILYHFVFDLEYFGLLGNLIGSPFFEAIGDIFRFSFLFLVGVSAYLFNSKMRDKAFEIQLKRFVTIFICSVLVTLITYFFDSDTYIFWGILHLISLSAIYFMIVKNNTIITFCFLCILFVLNFFNIQSESFYFQILGISELSRNTLDFFPILPWFAVILLGNLTTKYFLGIYSYFSSFNLNKFTISAGKRSLLIYMVHQPILLMIAYFLSKIILSVKS